MYPKVHWQSSHVRASQVCCTSPANSLSGHTLPHMNTLRMLGLSLRAVKLVLWMVQRHPSQDCLDKYNERTHTLHLTLHLGAAVNSGCTICRQQEATESKLRRLYLQNKNYMFKDSIFNYYYLKCHVRVIPEVNKFRSPQLFQKVKHFRERKKKSL